MRRFIHDFIVPGTSGAIIGWLAPNMAHTLMFCAVLAVAMVIREATA